MSAGADLPARRWRGWRWLLGVSALVPVAGALGSLPDPMLLIYSIFVAAWFARKPIASLAARVPLPGWALALLATLLVGGLTESLAWLGSFLAREPHPALLHPQLAYDLLLSPGIYAAWALAWMVVGRHYAFKLAPVFVLQGIYGVFIEQQGAVFLQGATSLPAGLLLWLYVFLVYGSAMGLAVLFWPPGLLAEDRRRQWLRFPLALGLNLVFTAMTAVGWGMLLTPLHLPEPRPIWEAPLW